MIANYKCADELKQKAFYALCWWFGFFFPLDACEIEQQDK